MTTLTRDRRALPGSTVRGMIEEIRERGLIEVADGHAAVADCPLRAFQLWLDVGRLIACLEDSGGRWPEAIEDYLSPGVRPKTDPSPGPFELMDMLLFSVHAQRRGIFWDRLYEGLLPLRRDMTEHIYQGDGEML